jgi:glutamyl-tRNA reductase
MIDQYKIITITHHDLNVNELERFVVKKDDDGNLSRLKEIKESVGLEEIQYLSTCNRVMYFFYTSQDISDDFLASFLQAINPDFKNDKLSSLKKFVRVFEGQKAIQHFFAVSSSLDSLVIGEREILRQCKDSYKANSELGLTGDNLRLVNEYMIMAAKDVYSNTRIGEKPVSIVSLAIQKLLKSFIKPSDRLLLIGAGETIELVSKFLTKHAFSNISIFNRSIDNAEKLSNQLGADAFHLSELETYSGGFDCIIACTGATQAIVTPTIYDALLRSDEDQKLVIDLAVPNNVDRSIADKQNVEIIDIENLRELAEENLKFRKTEVGEADRIVSTHVDTFVDIHRQRQIEKSLSSLPKEINAVKKRALEQVYSKQLETLDDDTKSLIHDMMNYMEKKCIGIPMKMAKQSQLDTNLLS